MSITQVSIDDVMPSFWEKSWAHRPSTMKMTGAVKAVKRQNTTVSLKGDGILPKSVGIPSNINSRNTTPFVKTESGRE